MTPHFKCTYFKLKLTVFFLCVFLAVFRQYFISATNEVNMWIISDSETNNMVLEAYIRKK